MHLSSLCCRWINFLCVLCTLEFLSDPFQIQASHMSFIPRSRCQSILGILWFHLWTLGGQMYFSCVHSRHRVSNQFSPHSHQICLGQRFRSELIFGTLQFHFWPPGNQITLFDVCTLNPRVFKWSFSNSHHTFLTSRPRSQLLFGPLQFHFGHWGAKFILFSCTFPPPLPFNGSFRWNTQCKSSIEENIYH